MAENELSELDRLIGASSLGASEVRELVAGADAGLVNRAVRRAHADEASEGEDALSAASNWSAAGATRPDSHRRRGRNIRALPGTVDSRSSRSSTLENQMPLVVAVKDDLQFDTPTPGIEDISGDYTLDVAHSRLGFSARHAMVATVRGSFKEFEGYATIDIVEPARSRVSLTIKAASVDTGDAERDGDLISGDFFENEAHPNITFESTDVEFDGETWNITGDLTIKGTTKSVTVPFEQIGSSVKDSFGDTRVGFEGAVAINRTDWGLTFNAALETGGVLVSEKIKLEFDISAIKVEDTPGW